jgi:hypothetical protein
VFRLAAFARADRSEMHCTVEEIEA